VTRKKLFLIIGGVLLAAAIVGANLYFRRSTAPTVQAEKVQKRDLTAIVSASGKIRPKREVNITSEVSGKVTKLEVDEGQRVKPGQFLLQIDPRQLSSAVERGDASLQAQKAGLQQATTMVEGARIALDLAKQNLKRQQDLWKDQLTTRENLDRAESEVKSRESDLQARMTDIGANEQRIRQMAADLENARYNLSRVSIDSPIEGIVTRRNVEVGETATAGFTNNPSVVLLTIADMSVVEAEIEVDETDIPSVQIGQTVEVTIDAMPDRKFTGRVTEIGNSPIQTQNTGAAGQQATNFRVVVTLNGQIPEVRPGFTCTAEITTATRTQALSVPIQAMAVRELIYDKDDKIVPQPKEDTKRRQRKTEKKTSDDDLLPGQKRKETEGVFVFRDNGAQFTPVKTGIAGDKYFEVLSGLKDGDQVITGPIASVRDLADGAEVKLEQNSDKKK
jgi:HlyD family secretion protein